MTFLVIFGMICVMASLAVVASARRSRRNEDGNSDGSGGYVNSGLYFGGSDYCESGSDGSGGDGGD